MSGIGYLRYTHRNKTGNYMCTSRLCPQENKCNLVLGIISY